MILIPMAVTHRRSVKSHLEQEREEAATEEEGGGGGGKEG